MAQDHSRYGYCSKAIDVGSIFQGYRRWLFIAISHPKGSLSASSIGSLALVAICDPGIMSLFSRLFAHFRYPGRTSTNRVHAPATHFGKALHSRLGRYTSDTTRHRASVPGQGKQRWTLHDPSGIAASPGGSRRCAWPRLGSNGRFAHSSNPIVRTAACSVNHPGRFQIPGQLRRSIDHQSLR